MTSNISTNTCFVDNGEKFCEKFWKKFGKKFSTSEQEQSFYTSDIDPDQKSKKLYEAHKKFWNKQSSSLATIDSNNACELKITVKDKEIRLGSDSIMSIYWHWTGNNYPYKQMHELIKNIMEKDYSNNNENFKEFIRTYLQEANKIGGFVVFPRHPNSMNGRRGISAKIRDRFDLTLECIRRGYEIRFKDNDPNNPLADVLKEDEDFFGMFGEKEEGFKKYIDFFCLNSWVNDNYDNYEVKDLLSDDGNSLLPKDKWPQKILPCDFDGDERVKWWWNLYNNLMNRLDARNTDIQKLFGDKNK